jgi:hypothetical protein
MLNAVFVCRILDKAKLMKTVNKLALMKPLKAMVPIYYRSAIDCQADKTGI